MPIGELMRDIAASGMTALDSASILGLSRCTFQRVAKKHGVSHLFERSYRMSEISMRLREPAWSVISRLADKGMTRGAVAKEVGYNPTRFLKVLADHPELDPFPSSNKVAAYIADTGESFAAAVKRMAAQGMSVNATAKKIGYACGSGLAQALRARGLEVEFQERRKAAPKVKKERRKWVERGGPKGDDWRIQHRREYLIWKEKNERV